MPHADIILADDEIVHAVHQALVKRHPKSLRRGRPGFPAEVVLRLLILKHVRNWSYQGGNRACCGPGEVLLAGDWRWCKAVHGSSRTVGPRRPAPDSGSDATAGSAGDAPDQSANFSW